MMKRLMLAAAISLVLSTGSHSVERVPTYGDVADITDLQGVAAGEAEKALKDRGYERVYNSLPTSLWWNNSTKTCASITMTGGSVTYVEVAPAGDCSR